jgi:hypothetical protein
MQIGIGIAENDIVVEYHIISGAVSDKHIAVPVQYITPGSFYPGDSIEFFDIVRVAAGLHDLQIVQPQGKKAQQQTERHQNYGYA